ncbi:hypothetical protein [Subtercola endophyticus]|uniref:hypothetical protein n=1 Tax=Subtercola endophyticus TaxID=2895559 RepID=UPI001E36AB90|nr:hypothetical protein [Subtercola endophyticus]UFS60810.1 hypothetical protein LQ955_08775 [Subtercola endophyticus]
MNPKRRTVSVGLASAAVLALALSGCTQIAAVAPVGGNHQTEVRYAAIDVLTTAGTDILTAPVCAASADGTITCTGATTTGDTITAVSPATDTTVLTVTVGAKTLYSGSILNVLNDAARSTS